MRGSRVESPRPSPPDPRGDKQRLRKCDLEASTQAQTAQRGQPSPTQQPRPLVNQGCPKCFTCGQEDHLSWNCPVNDESAVCLQLGHHHLLGPWGYKCFLLENEAMTPRRYWTTVVMLYPKARTDNWPTGDPPPFQSPAFMGIHRVSPLPISRYIPRGYGWGGGKFASTCAEGETAHFFGICGSTVYETMHGRGPRTPPKLSW